MNLTSCVRVGPSSGQDEVFTRLSSKCRILSLGNSVMSNIYGQEVENAFYFWPSWNNPWDVTPDVLVPQDFSFNNNLFANKFTKRNETTRKEYTKLQSISFIWLIQSLKDFFSK